MRLERGLEAYCPALKASELAVDATMQQLGDPIIEHTNGSTPALQLMVNIIDIKRMFVSLI